MRAFTYLLTHHTCQASPTRYAIWLYYGQMDISDVDFVFKVFKLYLKRWYLGMNNKKSS